MLVTSVNWFPDVSAQMVAGMSKQGSAPTQNLGERRVTSQHYAMSWTSMPSEIVCQVPRNSGLCRGPDLLKLQDVSDRTVSDRRWSPEPGGAFGGRYENTARVVLGELLSSQLLEPEAGQGAVPSLGVQSPALQGAALCQPLLARCPEMTTVMSMSSLCLHSSLEA